MLSEAEFNLFSKAWLFLVEAHAKYEHAVLIDPEVVYVEDAEESENLGVEESA